MSLQEWAEPALATERGVHFIKWCDTAGAEESYLNLLHNSREQVVRPSNHSLSSSPLLTFFPFDWLFSKTLSLHETAGNTPLQIHRESLILPIVALDASRWRLIHAKHCAGERFQSLRLKTHQKIPIFSLEKVLLGNEWLSASTWCSKTQPHWVMGWWRSGLPLWSMFMLRMHYTQKHLFLRRLVAVQPLICALSSPTLPYLME